MLFGISNAFGVNLIGRVLLYYGDMVRLIDDDSKEFILMWEDLY